MLSFIRAIWIWWYKPSIQGKMYGDDAIEFDSVSKGNAVPCSTSSILRTVEMAPLGTVHQKDKPASGQPKRQMPQSTTELYALLDNSTQSPRL
jgi:hypothetical protein